LKHITKLMINEFKIKKLGYDFMGYSLQKGDSYTFHHIIPKRKGGKYTRENGAILFTTSHEYLHKIELYEISLYDYIQQELLDINHKGNVDTINVKRIQDILKYFEDRYKNFSNSNHKKLIKETYLKRQDFTN